MRVSTLAVCTFCLAATAAPPASAQIAAPIVKGPATIELTPVATGLTSPSVLLPAPDGSGRLIVADQAGQIGVIDGGGLQGSLFADLSSRLVGLNPNYDERGLLGLAFHPDFGDPASIGYHKFYTYTSEPVEGAADFTVPLPPATAFNHQSVVNEWRVSDANPLEVDSNVARARSCGSTSRRATTTPAH